MADLTAQSSHPTVFFQDGSSSDWWRTWSDTSSIIKLQRYVGGAIPWEVYFTWDTSYGTSTRDFKVSKADPALVLSDTGGGAVDMQVTSDGTDLVLMRNSATFAQSTSEGHLRAPNGIGSPWPGTPMRWTIYQGNLASSGSYPRTLTQGSPWGGKLMGALVMLSNDDGASWQVCDNRYSAVSDDKEFYVQLNVVAIGNDSVTVTYGRPYNWDPEHEERGKFQIIMFHLPAA